MRTVHTIRELRALISSHRQHGHRVGLVPTMGNLHEGHISLVEKALLQADVVVTSIFVNPMQFGAGEDLESYPRTLREDQQKLEAAGNHIVFAPPVEEVYPHGLVEQTQVTVPVVSEGHCGASRPGHFDGVSTVVTMLFNMVQPDVAIFGEKDFQQLAVIRKMASDLFMPIEIVGAPTMRDEDGLARSSRNGYLTESERLIAPTLYKTLQQTAANIQNGQSNFAELEKEANETLSKAGFRPDYVNIANSVTLKPARPGDGEITILAAAFLGKTRLIDNLSIHRDS
ncbi:pantoate--beta-alanine ligase [Marinobacter nanhaiticus D15-8W]|uniref:Pantothenate synthetase n=1 Tax=Marinobacter nanhaiticus D15-8W TaxID=626887 RepID=N6W383_9GAMM|nr:pantoate--beta-alanine ligase [Marinobacter nanhaiticus]ENO14564.1 pantoate--beta-alanine ligase [Marinobacter nanhaiticus D15-8W]BES69796.1 pantoate--beta-alanine ligase [Marinobacter nanhaiticus D15-8W]